MNSSRPRDIVANVQEEHEYCDSNDEESDESLRTPGFHDLTAISWALGIRGAGSDLLPSAPENPGFLARTSNGDLRFDGRPGTRRVPDACHS